MGERFYIYAPKTKATPPVPPAVPIWSDDLRVAPPGSPPDLRSAAWMIELAEQVKLIEPRVAPRRDAADGGDRRVSRH